MKAKDVVLKLDGIRKSFTQHSGNENLQLEILKGIDLALKKGEVVSIVGPSGSGKTTLLKLIGLLDSPDEGVIEIDGVDVSQMNEDQLARVRRNKIGFVYQAYNLLPEFTAAENVAIPLIINGVKKEEAIIEAEKLIDSIGLKARAHFRPELLSGGEQQRMAILRSVILKPKLILADEPTGNLDHENSIKMFNVLLDQTRKYGIATIIVTHNHELAKMTDKVYKISLGELEG